MKFKGIEICCPHCKADLQSTSSDLRCVSCQRVFPVIQDIPDLRIFPDPYIDFDADRAKGVQVAARFGELDFGGLVDFYYSITSVVPPQHARQYKRGLMAGVARSQAALDSWASAVHHEGQLDEGCVLDLGCGTAPLLVAMAPRAKSLVGVDIAFRWLVVAKKRLAEAKIDLPLFCACAEALPFPDGLFDRVAADSVVEHFHDQPRALAECNRVMRGNGYLYLSTPNRFCPGPDPHVGLWGGSYLPDRWLAAYTRRQGGIPPKRRLLSERSLTRLLRTAGFGAPLVYLPGVSAAQRDQFGTGIRFLIDLYQAGRRLPVSGEFLRWVGPLLHAVAHKAADGDATIGAEQGAAPAYDESQADRKRA